MKRTGVKYYLLREKMIITIKKNCMVPLPDYILKKRLTEKCSFRFRIARLNA